MIEIEAVTIGEAWAGLVSRVVQSGSPMGDEGSEVLGVRVTFPASCERDPIVQQFGDPAMIAEMQKVFFTDAPNELGHTYANLMRGPDGRQDLQDVIALLRRNHVTKRAVVTFCPAGDGMVPCINVVQFMLRAGQLQTAYFSRGQDVYMKFYADALCIASMVQTVARGVGVPAGQITGLIASGHIYHRDMQAVRRLLATAFGDAGAAACKGGD
jgi:thymidylate synthase